MTRRDRRGLALLEVLVALVILSLVVLGYLRLLQGTHLLAAGSREWSRAAEYAGDGMERVKLHLPQLPSGAPEELPGGYRRRAAAEPWRPGLALVTLTVALPDGGRMELHRLVPADSGAPR